jgi:alpha-mannosidase
MAERRITVVPHTHWDREWYEPFEVFLERLVEMMDGLLELLDDGFPHFHLDGQAALLDDYMELRPQEEPRIRRLVEAGKLSVGPWYTQMDEFLTSGESHVRNLEWGIRRGDELGGALRAGYLPDQFGHVGQMPQILVRGGIDRAVVWRGVPASIDRTAFRWQAPDGSEVMTEYLPLGYSIGMQLRFRQDPAELAEALQDAVSWLAPMSARDRFLLTAGSDHHGPDPTLPSRLVEAEKFAPEIEARIGAIADQVALPVADDVPVWRGELRAAARAHLLPGVYSTRAHQKRERGRVEALVERYAEPLAALVPGFAWPTERLDRAWRLLLWNGAHDSVCGCSVDPVAHAVDARYAEARAIAETVADEALSALGSHVSTPGELVFNPSPFERDGVPGMGWVVVPPPLAAPERVEPVVEGGAVRVDDVELRFLDEPDVGDLYNFCPQDDAEPQEPSEIRVDGSRVFVAFDGLEVAFRVSRRPGERFLRIGGEIRNDRPDHRLRLHVTLPEPAQRAIAGAPFELVERGLVSEGSELEVPSPTWPARGVVLAGGVAVLHEGVFEYEVADDALAVTLLRCVGTISRPAIKTRPLMAGPDIPTPDAQMIGSTGFSLAVAPSVARDDLLEMWERFALPLRSASASGGGSFSPSDSLLDVGGAELSSIRRVDGRTEVRVWNSALEPTAATVDGREIPLGPAEIRTLALEGRR